MTIEIQMPALSPTMEEGTLSKWLVKEGDKISSGDVLAEIETDKATMEVESIDDGIVGKLLVDEGSENVPVGTLIAVLLEEGEDADAVADVSAKAPEPKKAGKKEEAKEIKGPAAPKKEQRPESGKANGKDRIFASPLARRLAADKGVDLADVKGSGPHGRIVKADIEGSEARLSAGSAQKAPSVAAEGDAPYEEVKLSNMRKVIAKRLTESKQTVPHYYLTVDCEIDKLLAARKEINDGLDGDKISVNDFVIRASALALMKVPDANVQFGGDVMRRYSRADISVAVAIKDGLVTPIIRGADQKGLLTISREMRELAGKAKEGKLAPEDYQGGTFSISNLGMFGIKQFDAVINPPQAAILAVSAGELRPVVKDGQLVPATVMTCTLSCDHRAIDGAAGATFLKAFKGFIDEPVTMLL